MQVRVIRNRSVLAIVGMGFFLCFSLPYQFAPHGYAQETSAAKTLSGTSILDIPGDVASELVDGVDRFLLKELNKSIQNRVALWPKPNESALKTADNSAYEAAIQPLREELRVRIGMIDARVKCEAFTMQSNAGPVDGDSIWVAANETCKIVSVRWRIFDGVDATGLLVVPNGEIRFSAVVVPDAGQTPERLCGLDETSSLVAMELAARGGVVVIPDVIRRHREARNGRAKLTDQEFLYRSAFVLGRHVIGYQVQEISAAFDALLATYGKKPTLIAGWGEGGSLALFAAVVDTRIQVACVSGHFGPREGIWSEPIHRNVHGLLNHFGDAQLAAMIAPRTLVVDAVPGPNVDIPGEGGAPGKLSGPSIAQAQLEWENAETLLRPWRLSSRNQIVKPTEGISNESGTSLQAIQMSLKAIGINQSPDISKTLRPATWKGPYVASEETRRMDTVSKWNRFQQAILERSATERDLYWRNLDTKSPESFAESIKPYYEFFRKETIGDWEWESVPFRPRTRLIYDEPKYLGYEVVPP